jgi:hypothetical protein
MPSAGVLHRASHEQVPPRQSNAKQELPQLPQLSRSLSVSTHRPEQ